jgi:tetratricopeptide (TPR) repeat protein
MSHFDDDELAQYAFDPEGVPDREAIEAHLRECPSCTSQLAFIRTIEDGLRDEEPWDIANSISAGPDVSRLVELAGRVEAEDAEAEVLLAPLLESPLRFVWADVSRKERYRSPGVVRALCRAALAACEKHPLHALDLANAAVSIAEELPVDLYPSRAVFGLRGMAWKDRANALRYLGRYGEALVSLDEAVHAYQELKANALELAVVDFVRATVLMSGDQFDEALFSVRRCEPVFREYREEVRYRHARLLEASILFMKRDMRAARPILTDLFDLAERHADRMLTARAAHNLGLVELEMGELAKAGEHLSTALGLYTALELATEVIRTRWSLARLAAARGDLDDALERFQAVREEFRRQGIIVDEALVALDIADLLLTMGDPVNARAIASELFGTFRKAGMMTSALTAIGFLNEAATQGRLTPRLVRHVRGFLERVQRQPELLFAPPFDDGAS